MLQQIKSYLSKGNRAQWCVFIAFALVIFIKCILFHWFSFHSVLISSLWRNPFEFFRFWGGKIVPALFLGSFVFSTRQYWWTVIVNLICDIWLIANLFYYKANTLFLSLETMKMADNLNGFWDSLYTYMGWDIIVFILITILYAVLYFTFIKVKNEVSIIKCISLVVLSLIFSVFNNYCYAKVMHGWNNKNEAVAQVHSQMLSSERFHYYFPFGHAYYYSKIEKCTDYDAWTRFYIKDYSILSYLPATCIFNAIRPAGEVITLSTDEIAEFTPFFNPFGTKTVPKTNLIFILFESLEAWPIGSVCGYNFMPNIENLVHNKHVLYCDKLKSQTRHGNSADGQMIAATGVLPIANGATCRLYADNRFPSFADCYSEAAIVNPTPGTWGQEKMTFGYQFKTLIEPQLNQNWDDEGVIKEMLQYIDTIGEHCAVLGITVTSHVPFSYGAEHMKFSVEGMPQIMSAYLNCLSYTDSCVGVLIDSILGNDTLKNNTTIVISGDHTIFRSQNLEIDNFAASNGIDMRTTKTFTPLIIYSPHISENVQLTDTFYQMDIYPTIMHLIGCEDYYWKGFGVNLLDSVARNNRPISEQEAFILSDKLIRANWFESYTKEK